MNTPKPLSVALPTLLVALSAGCSKHHHDDPVVVIPAFGEVESNDGVFEANDFGFLAPGDHFFIDGFITDSGADPFDGFLFTSAEAVHVDFQLFIDNAFADLDVCLYDPQIDATVDCFATDLAPERGGVDVFGPNLDFHLVVESFIGASSYSLEIRVYPLFGALTGAEEGEGQAALARIASAPSDEVLTLRAEGGAKNDRAAAFEAYGKAAQEERPAEGLQETVQHFDPETGVMSILTRPVEEN